MFEKMQPRFGVQVRNFPLEYDDTLIENIARASREVESLRFDSIWMIDHLMLEPPIAPEPQAVPECWSTLAYICSKTSRLKIGPLVCSVLFRPALQLAHTCLTLDKLSNHRLIVGLGSGWYEEEFRKFGIDFPPPRKRVAAVEGAITSIRGLEDKLRTSADGSKVTIWLGGSGEKLTLPMVARLADGCSLQGSAELIQRRIALLKAIASPERLGHITISKQSNIIIDSTEDGVKKKLRKIIPDDSKWNGFKQSNIVGTPDECVVQIEKLASLGVSYFTLNFPDLFELESIRLFDEHVIGRIKETEILGEVESTSVYA
jgi:alkanesulfonate monooxygenase SsuD/methylene tetrahydromethanopterin reductase-like flavin-dependent oxidoreductase (luciferase family)